jgi:hypothetical protein
MSFRQSQLTGRLRLLHLLECTEAKAEEMAEMRPRFERLANKESAPRVVSAFNLFQTPEPLAARLAGMLPNIGRTLEPSAGLGRLYRAVRALDASAHVTLVDSSPECCGELYKITEADTNARLVQGDFLEQSPSKLGLFDSIIMNPPFKMWRDIKHVVHAQKFLCPGGRLVALCANGPRQREKLQPIASEWYDLPAGSFKESFTNVAAALLVIDA